MPPDTPALILQVTDQVPGASNRATASQAYRLHTEGNRLHLTAASELGLTYAVWGLLEDHLGVLFLDPQTEVVPSRADLSLGPLDEVQEPAFVSRRAIDERDSPWLLKNRGGGTPGLWSNHSFFTWMPPSNFETHPEWFALIKGKRQTHAAMGLCGTNEALAVALAENLMKAMAKTDPSVPLRVGQGDGFVACECEACRALVTREESEAAPYLLMLNRALEITSQQYPDHKLVTFAYYATLAPPKTLRPHPNLYLNVVSTSLRGNCDQLGPIRDNPANAACAAAAEGWPQIAPGRVSVWHWSGNFRAKTVEWPDLFNMCDNFRFWHENGIVAVHPEMAGGNWYPLRHWLYTRLMWDPTADEKALIQKFLTAYYGPRAAPLLWEYLRYTADLAARSGLTASGLTDAHVLRQRLFPDDKLQQMTEMMETAVKAAQAEPDPAYATRVSQAMATSVDLLHLLGPEGLPLPFAKVVDPRDHREWLVPGGQPDLPERIDRLSQVYRDFNLMDWAAAWWSGIRFRGYAGGPLVRSESSTLKLEVVPNLEGQVTSLIYKPTGSELLAWDADPRVVLAYRKSGYGFGYADVPSTSGQEWSAEPDSAPGVLAMTGELHREVWWYAPGLKANQQLRRTLELAPETPRLTLTRTFVGNQVPAYASGTALPNPSRFGSRWRLAVPVLEKARLAVAGGGLQQELSLAKADKTELKVAAPAGDLVIELDRGDGLRVRLTTPASGWESISLQAVPGKQQLVVDLIGQPHEMGPEPRTLEDLPLQHLEVIPNP